MTTRTGAVKTVRDNLSRTRLLLMTAVALVMTTTVVCASFLATTTVHAVAPSIDVFDFDTGSPPPFLYQNTPFNYLTLGGVTAYFSSPSDSIAPAFSVQNSIPVGYNMSMFSGQWLYDNQASSDYLDVKFDCNVYSINLTFAVIEPHGGPGIQPSYINLSAYMDSVSNPQVGWTWARGETASEQNTQGTLSFNSSGQPFNLVRIGIPPNQPPFYPTDFFVDNIVIMATLALDSTPPVTTASLTGTLGDAGWYRSDVTVSLVATDDMSGVNRIEYSYDNTVWTTYIAPFLVTTEGTTTIYYKATDNAGNIESAKSQLIRIDRVVPATTINLSGVLGNGGWYRSDVTVTLSAYDGVSGVAQTEYSYDSITWTVYTAPFSIVAEGISTVYYKSRDTAGNTETAKAQAVKVDKSSPTTTVSLSGVLGNAGWYTSTVTVTLTASDSVSGVAISEYSSDGTIWAPYTAPFVISNQGTNVVHYRSADVAGNAELAATQTVKVDAASPVTTISLSGAPGDLAITLSATDSASGVSKIEYSFDNSQWTVYTVPFIVTDPATTIVYYRSTDVAGNAETVKTKILTGDNIPPITTVSLSGVLGDQGWHTSNVEVSLSAIDDWSGVAKTEFSFDNIAWTTYATPFNITTEGTTIVYYRSTDAIGNVEATLSQTVKIDKSSPTGSILIDGDAASTTSTSVTLTVTSNDAFSGVFKVRYSNDGMFDTEQWEIFSTTKTWTLTPELGTKTVHFQIMDNAGLISATYQDSITLETSSPPVDTTKPVANAGPDQAATEDASVTFDGSASTDNVAVATYTWTFTDGTSKTLAGMKPNYTFNTPGIYTIMLNVTDAAANWATDVMILEVLDITNPIADAGQDRTVSVGMAISFDAGASSDNVGIIEYEWDCGDGTNHTGKTISHAYDTPGTYTVTLTLADAAGNIGIDSITITVLPPSQPYTLWLVLAIVAIGIGVTVALFLRKGR